VVKKPIFGQLIFNGYMNKTERPLVLQALCLLSLTGSGGGIILYMLAAIFYGRAQEFIIKYSSMHTTETIPPLYFLVLAGFFSFSLFGVFKMWRLRKQGFFIYTAAQIFILVIPLIWLGKEAFSSAALIFTLVFVIAYASQYRKLH
jgi:hypothetical protein